MKLPHIKKSVIETGKNIGTGVLLLTGINGTVYGYVHNWNFLATLVPTLAVLAGLDLRYYAVRVKAKIKIEHKLDEIAANIQKEADEA